MFKKELEVSRVVKAEDFTNQQNLKVQRAVQNCRVYGGPVANGKELKTILESLSEEGKKKAFLAAEIRYRKVTSLKRLESNSKI